MLTLPRLSAFAVAIFVPSITKAISVPAARPDSDSSTSCSAGASI
jgi:hypothetical protein